MKYKDVKIGMKVVPHSKSVGMTLNDSNVVKRAKEINRPFLYVSWFYGDKIILSEKNQYDGLEDIEDLFLASDFEPYINESEAKTRDTKVDNKAVNEEQINYKDSYERLMEMYKELQQENEDLKKALVKIALKL